MSGGQCRGNMKTQVCAVTVASNKPEELERLLSSLEQQDHSLNGLIVVDDSDDSHLAKNKGIFNRFSKKCIHASYHKLETNMGSAGGFHLGMQVAHENGFDWVWLLDQEGTFLAAT
jgi:rhamnopyranosyl-N-acetylglucosaminyl-diphospho-decaprenol beta-1,3/1,4-galactofuranosyltransferase